MGFNILIPLALSWLAARKVKKEVDAMKREAYEKGKEFAEKYAPRGLGDTETLKLWSKIGIPARSIWTFGWENPVSVEGYNERLLEEAYRNEPEDKRPDTRKLLEDFYRMRRDNMII